MNLSNEKFSARIMRLVNSGIFAFRQWSKKHRRSLTVTTVFLVLVFSFSIAFSARAEGEIVDAIAEGLTWLIMTISNLLGTMVAMLFKLIIIASSYDNLVGSGAITRGWVIIRDLCNMAVVILLLVYAFAHIVNQEDKILNKGGLVKLLLAAVAINFSRLACAVMIDVSQIFMMTFVNGFAATAGANLVNGLGMTSYYQFAKSTDGNAPSADWVQVFMIASLSAIFMGVTLVVTVMLGVFLIVRIAAFWFLIVLSPFGFLSITGFKFLQKYTQKWWTTFTGLLVSGPLLAFMLWLSLLVMQDASSNIMTPKITQTEQLSATEQAAQAAGGAATSPLSNMATFFPFAVALGMLGGTYSMTKNVGKMLGDSMGGAVNKAMGTAAGMTKKYTGYDFAKAKTKAGAAKVASKVKEKKDSAIGLANAGLAIAGATIAGSKIGKLTGGTKGAVGGLARAPGAAVKTVAGEGARGGREAYKAAYDKAIDAGKGKTAAAIIASGAAIGGGVMGVKGSGGKALAAMKSSVVESADAGYHGAGSAGAAFKAERDEKLIGEEEKKMAKLKGPENKDALKAVARDPGRSRHQRAAAMKMLGSQNFLDGKDDKAMIGDVRNLFAGSKGSLRGIDNALGDKFAHLKYDVKGDSKKVKDDASKGKFAFDKMDSSVLSDPASEEFVNVAAEGMGSKRFVKQVTGMAESDPTKKGVATAAFKNRADAARASMAAGDGKWKRDDYLTFASAHAQHSDDIEGAFAGSSDTEIEQDVGAFMSANGENLSTASLEKLRASSKLAGSAGDRARKVLNVVTRQSSSDDMKDMSRRGNSDAVKILVDLKDADITKARTILNSPGSSNDERDDARNVLELHMTGIKRVAATAGVPGDQYERLRKQFNSVMSEVDKAKDVFDGKAAGGKWAAWEGKEYSVDKSGKMREREAGSGAAGVFMTKEQTEEIKRQLESLKSKMKSKS